MISSELASSGSLASRLGIAALKECGVMSCASAPNGAESSCCRCFAMSEVEMGWPLLQVKAALSSPMLSSLRSLCQAATGQQGPGYEKMSTASLAAVFVFLR